MSKLLNTLAKIGLVELDAEDLSADPAADTTPPVEAATSPAEQVIIAGPGSVAVGTAAELPRSAPESQRPLAEIYQAAGVPEAVFPAEKLLRILDGLRAMDAATRKAAVTAMDAADDDWSVDDAVEDSRHKIVALQQARTDLEAELQRAASQAQTDLQAQDQYQEQATASIRQQITDLEALLQRELEKVGQERTAIQTQLQKTRDACAYEATRLETEIRRLQEVAAIFATTSPAPDPNASNP